jgi:hypothetical protein
MFAKLRLNWAVTSIAVVRKIGLAVAVVFMAGMLAVPANADGNNRHVRIVNSASQPVYNVYGSNVHRSSWEEDVLGDTVLMPGHSVDINFDDGSGECMFDFKIVFKDQSQVIRRHINVCEIETYTLTD